jgi:hypothetical protein
MNVHHGRRTIKRIAPILALASAVVVCSANEESRAQAPLRAPLLGKLALRYRRARSGAPLPVVWKFDWPERTVARGALEYEVYDEQTRLGEFRIPDLVLAPGKNEFNALLPTFFVGSSATMLTIRGRFVTSGRSLEFDEQTLRVPTPYVQWFSVGVVAGAKSVTVETEMKFFDKIRLETFLPPDEAQNQSATVAFDLKTAELPSDALTLCNFDVLVLTPPALAELKEEQAAALRKWVRAGGSLCVVTGGGLETRHAELLNDLASESHKRVKFVVGPNGFLLPDDAPPDILRAPKGLGRVAVLREKLLQTVVPDGTTWLEAANYLLKGHRNKVAVRQGEPQSLSANNRRAARGARASSPGTVAIRPGPIQVPGRSPWFGGSLHAAPLGHLGELFQLLMPLGVSAIPLSVIVLILTAYVVTIGPVDYFLLGALRLRRFTWVLFPVVTIGFAAFTLWLSERYLGSSDSRRAIEIYDVVPGGTVARRTRIEMLFLGQENTVATEVENGLFSLVGRGNVMSPVPVPAASGKQMVTAAAMMDGSVGVEDRFPSSYRIAQQVAQWRPVLNRFFWIDPKPSTIYRPPGAPRAGAFDWDQLPNLSMSASGLADRVRQAFGPDASAFVLRGPTMIPVLNDGREFKFWRSITRSRTVNFPVLTIVRELCQRTPDQLFQYAYCLSPNGGPELDDLAISDATDKQGQALVIVVETESTLYLYRRAYSGSQ